MKIEAIHFELGQTVVTDGAGTAIKKILTYLAWPGVKWDDNLGKPIFDENSSLLEEVIEVNCNRIMTNLLIKHSKLDQGKLCDEDHELNKKACEQEGQFDDDGNSLQSRIFSSFEYEKVEFWVITELDRESTTIFLPDEY